MIRIKRIYITNGEIGHQYDTRIPCSRKRQFRIQELKKISHI